MSAIRLTDLTLGYDRHPAIHHLSGEIAAGSLTAIVGPNGAGKSTLLKGITGTLSPLSGGISVASGKRLAYLKDSGFGPLEQYLKVNKSIIATTEMTGDKDFAKRLFAFLGLKRADAVIVTTDVFDFGQAQGDIAKGFKRAGCLAQEKMAVGLSPANAERSGAIGAALDRGIAKLRRSGALKQILARYGMQVWPE